MSVAGREKKVCHDTYKLLNHVDDGFRMFCFVKRSGNGILLHVFRCVVVLTYVLYKMRQLNSEVFKLIMPPV